MHDSLEDLLARIKWIASVNKNIFQVAKHSEIFGTFLFKNHSFKTAFNLFPPLSKNEKKCGWCKLLTFSIHN